MSDGDEVNNIGSSPLDTDSDGGTIDDGTEVSNGTNPVNNPDDDLVGQFGRLNPRNTDNLDDAGGIETNNTYATELVTLANGRLIMVSSERGTATDGISTYEIDNDPTSATYGQIIGTRPELSGHDDLGAKIDSIGGEIGQKVGYGEIADLASVTLANGRTFVYTADFEKDAIGVAEINPNGTLTERSVVQNTATLDGMKELSIANVGGTNYLIGLSTGHSDNLVVFEIESDGTLRQTDIKGDGSNAGENYLNGGGHFDNASTLTSFTNRNGQTFVLAGGDDDGISLWTLNANGDLTLEATRDNRDVRNGGDDFLTSDHDVGLHDVNVAKFVEIGGATYVFAGGQDDEIVTFRIDQAGNGDFSLNLVGQTGNIIHDISSMGVLPTGELVVGGEQQGLRFYAISVNGNGTVSLNETAFVRDEGEPLAELWDSEDIDIEGGIMVSASDADSGIAVLDLYDRS